MSINIFFILRLFCTLSHLPSKNVIPYVIRVYYGIQTNQLTRGNKQIFLKFNKLQEHFFVKTLRFR
jgi:hypothetical protein